MVNSSGGEGGSGGGGGGGGDTGAGGSGGSGGGPQQPSASPAASGLLQLGCGPSGLLTLHVTTTTGRNFSVIVDSEKTVVHLKKIISKNLKVSKDRICLLHRERVLHDGTLRENGLVEGSKIILTPNVETGLLTQRAENTVMQALESLNDKQVNDFLSGKSPLNLSVRLGDHMMLIQLQLSTLNPSASQAASVGTGGMSFSGGGRIKASTSSASAAPAAAKSQHAHHAHQSGQSPETVEPLGLGGSKAPAGATSSKANVLARRPAVASGAPADSPDDELEQPAVKRPARLESHRRESESATTPHRCGVASTSKMGSGTSETLYTKAPRAKNNNDRCSGENNNSFRNDSNISKTTRDSRSTIDVQEDQPHEAMEHDDEEKSEQTGEDETLVHRLASATSNNHQQSTAPVAVSSPIKSLSKLVSARTMTSDEEKDADDAATSATADDLDIGAGRPAASDGSAGAPGMAECSDPITANLTSCLCRRLDGGGEGGDGKGKNTAPSEGSEAASPGLLHRTALNPIAKHKARLQGMGKKTSPVLAAASSTYVADGARTDGQLERTPPASGAASASSSRVHRLVLFPNDLMQQQNAPFAGAGRRLLFSTLDCAQQNLHPQAQQIRPKRLTYIADPPSPLKNPALAEASRNLTQTLRKLSKRVFTTNVASPAAALSSPGSSPSSSAGAAGAPSASSALPHASAEPSSGTSSPSSVLAPSTSSFSSSASTSSSSSSSSSAQSAPLSLPSSSSGGGRSASSGAIIESMKHHGKGIYSGTFSGTLNPALQDKFGRPKRDISTIIHILNDLLSAAPQCATGSEATASGSHPAPSSSSSSSHSSGTKVYFDPTAGAAGPSGVGTGSGDATNADFAVAGTSAGSSAQRHNCTHYYQSNRNGAGGSAVGGSNTSWFVPAPSGSKRSSSENEKNLSESGVALANVKGSTSAATGSAEDTVARGGLMEDGACVGCKLPSGSTNRAGGASSSGYRSLVLSSADGSPSCTFVPLSPSAIPSSMALCQCGSGLLVLKSSTGGALQPQQQCKLCTMKAVEMENSKTKLKLDSLRLIMKQKRERREARKVQSAPYQSTVGAAPPRAGANEPIARPNKLTNVPVHVGSHGSNVTADQQSNEGAVGISNSRLPERQQREDRYETQTLSSMQGQLEHKTSIDESMLPRNDRGEPTTSNSSTTDADVPLSNPTDAGEAVSSDDVTSAGPSDATKAAPEAPTPSSATDPASSSSADASNGATHLVEEVDTVA